MLNIHRHNTANSLRYQLHQLASLRVGLVFFHGLIGDSYDFKWFQIWIYMVLHGIYMVLYGLIGANSGS